MPSNYLEMMEPQYLDADEIAPPTVSRGEKPRPVDPDIPDEDEEAIYEPVDLTDDPVGDHDYADPDACLDRIDVKKAAPPRPNMRRTELAKAVPEKSQPLPEDTRHWDATDVLRWLVQENLEDFKDVFYANGFEGPMLLTLSSSSFKAGGFDPARCDVLQISLNKLQTTTKPLFQARVLYSYDAKKSSQLSVREGTIVRPPFCLTHALSSASICNATPWSTATFSDRRSCFSSTDNVDSHFGRLIFWTIRRCGGRLRTPRQRSRVR